MAIKLKWNDPNLSEEGTRIYRSDSPIDPNNLPPPVGTVGPNVTEWEDADIVVGNTYYYRVGAFAAAQERVSDEILVDTSVIPDPPLGYRFRSAGAFAEVGAFTVQPLDVPLPPGSAGDLLIMGVMHRGDLTIPAGWVLDVVTDPPTGSISNHQNQRVSILRRTSDGSETSPVTLVQTAVASGVDQKRLEAQCLRFASEGNGEAVLIGAGKKNEGPRAPGEDDNHTISLSPIPAIPFGTIAVAVVSVPLNATTGTSYLFEVPDLYSVTSPNPRQQHRFSMAWAYLGQPLSAGGQFVLSPPYVGTGEQYQFACQAVYGCERT